MSKDDNHPIERQRGILALLVRPFWMFLGNFILLISAALIFSRENSDSYAADVVFWSTVAILVAVRFFDIKFLDGLTATGQPASIAHWRRYAVVLTALSAAIWVMAHFAAHWFKA